VRGLIDLTNLDGACTPASIEHLCARAVDHVPPVPAVCVWPAFVAQAVGQLRGSGVRVATVVNFPAGGTDVEATVAETQAVLADGADEVDLVLPYRAFLAGDVATSSAMVRAVRAVVPTPHHLKVILETGGYPSQAEVRAAADLAVSEGADFVKTSTGKTDRSATPEAVRTLLEAIRDSGRPVGVNDAAAYLALADEVMGPTWATAHTFRFGASGLLDAVDAVLDGRT
jgi:deoxyribose-phosphate aldolase